MSSTARRVIVDLVASASGLLILVVALVLLDERVREQFTVAGHGTDIATAGSYVHSMGLVVALFTAHVVNVAREQTLEHTHFVAFSVAAVVLVIFLLRL